MNIFSTLKNFLYDEKYLICIYDNNIYLYGFKEIYKIEKENIEIRFNDFLYNIFGSNMKVTKMNNKELLINGVIKKTEIIND